MEALIIIFYLGVLIFYIWMICLFVGMTKDIRILKTRFTKQSIDFNDIHALKQLIKISELEGTQDEIYRLIVRELCDVIYKNSRHGYMKKDGRVILIASATPGEIILPLKPIEEVIPIVDRCLKEIGKELPEELKSVLAYAKFYNSQSSERDTN